MLTTLHRFIVPAATALLPSTMGSSEATALLLTIALQESGAGTRRQTKGPARGFWQFEVIGVRGVLEHPHTRGRLQSALIALAYPPGLDAVGIHTAIEHNDVLACALARLLLWTVPEPLPTRFEAADAWRQYLSAWRPGKPRPQTWDAYYARAWRLVAPETP